MIIVRSPLRITLGGGGTDIPSYYEEHGGFCIAAAIDRYVYITVHETFVDDLIIKYSQLERVMSATQVKHPIFRETLGLLGINGRSLEISSMADIPAGTGLGSSSSFVTALLYALHTHQNTVPLTKYALAEEACHIEIDLLKEPIGKQDQYISVFGGINTLEFSNTGKTRIFPLRITPETFYNLEDNLVLFFTGYLRSASQILSTQNQGSNENLSELKIIAYDTEDALMHGNMKAFARLLNEQWEHKKKRHADASNQPIDNWHALGLRNGALGGKLVGAGGGGFLMFYAEDKTSLRLAMKMAGLREVRFRFDSGGTQRII